MTNLQAFSIIIFQILANVNIVNLLTKEKNHDTSRKTQNRE